MEIKEAIELLKEYQHKNSRYPIVVMLLNETITTLEKQVPKRVTVGPVPGYEHYTSMLLYACPACHSVLGDNASGYCRFCGQKLKGESE